MQETRRQRLAAVIQEELSVTVRGLKDPRIPSVTFTAVDVAEDASFATVFVSILGGSSDQEMQNCLKGLESASGFLRRHLAKALTIRHIPQLSFKADRGLENAAKVHELLKKISAEG